MCINPIFCATFHSQPRDKNMDLTKLKAFADCRRQSKCDSNDGIYLQQGESILRTEENPSYNHFLIFRYCYRKASLSGSHLLSTGENIQTLPNSITFQRPGKGGLTLPNDKNFLRQIQSICRRQNKCSPNDDFGL